MSTVPTAAAATTLVRSERRSLLALRIVAAVSGLAAVALSALASGALAPLI